MHRMLLVCVECQYQLARLRVFLKFFYLHLCRVLYFGVSLSTCFFFFFRFMFSLSFVDCQSASLFLLDYSPFCSFKSFHHLKKKASFFYFVGSIFFVNILFRNSLRPRLIYFFYLNFDVKEQSAGEKETMSYLCSGHDVGRLDHVQQPTILRLVDRNSPIMKDEKLLTALTQKALFCLCSKPPRPPTTKVKRTALDGKADSSRHHDSDHGRKRPF